MTSAPTRPRRRWRWLRRTAVTLVSLWLALTLASLIGNARTTPPATLDAGQGADVTVGSTRMHYQRWGEVGSPIVLVHGFAESTVAWTPTAEILARQHTVVALDLAGYGYTDYTGNYTLADQTALVIGAIRALHLTRPTLVGHSMCAAVVGNVALKYPTEVGGVIFADGDALPFAGQSSRGSSARWILKTPYATSAYRLVTRWSWLSNKLVRAQCGSTCLGVTPELVDAWMRPLRQGDAETSLTAMAGAGLLHLQPSDIQAIVVPRGIIWGAEDATSGGSLTDTQANLKHPTTVIIPGAGHLSMVSDPATFAAAVEKISSEWSAR